MKQDSRLLPFFSGVAVMALVGLSAWMLRPRATEMTASTSITSAPETARLIKSPYLVQVPAGMETGDDAAIMQAASVNSAQAAAAGEQRLRLRYEGERVDAAWAASKQQVLESLSVSPQIEQVNAQPLAIVANCRKTVCRIDADFPSRTAADDWFTLYTLNAGPEMTHSSSRNNVNPDGSVHLQIYGLARQ